MSSQNYNMSINYTPNYCVNASKNFCKKNVKIGAKYLTFPF